LAAVTRAFDRRLTMTDEQLQRLRAMQYYELGQHFWLLAGKGLDRFMQTYLDKHWKPADVPPEDAEQVTRLDTLLSEYLGQPAMFNDLPPDVATHLVQRALYVLVRRGAR
jgi:hypothetical protein